MGSKRLNIGVAAAVFAASVAVASQSAFAGFTGDYNAHIDIPEIARTVDNKHFRGNNFTDFMVIGETMPRIAIPNLPSGGGQNPGLLSAGSPIDLFGPDFRDQGADFAPEHFGASGSAGIPAPGAAGLIGLAAAASIRRRRR